MKIIVSDEYIHMYYIIGAIYSFIRLLSTHPLEAYFQSFQMSYHLFSHVIYT